MLFHDLDKEFMSYIDILIHIALLGSTTTTITTSTGIAFICVLGVFIYTHVPIQHDYAT